MKKLLIATALTVCALSAQAGNIYVQGDLGSSVFTLDDTTGTSSAVFNQRLSLGYDFGNQFRIALDYTNFGKLKESGTNGYYYATATLKVKSLGITGFYDFNISSKSKFVPYVGLRLSHNKVSATLDSNALYTGSGSETSTGLGILGGVQYKFSERLSLNANLEYNKLSSDLGLGEGSAKIGLRYNF